MSSVDVKSWIRRAPSRFSIVYLAIGLFLLGTRGTRLALREQIPQDTLLTNIGGDASLEPAHALPMTFSPDGSTLATGGPDGSVELWETGMGRFKARFEEAGIVGRLAYSPDGRV